MKYADVLRDSWKITIESRKLKWFAFIPSLVALVFFVAEILWQFYFYSTEFGFLETHVSLNDISGFVGFLSDKSLLGVAIFGVIFVLIFTFIMPSWIDAVLILGVKKKFEEPDVPISLRRKILEGFSYFFNLFELKAVMSPFAISTILLTIATLFRIYHGELFSLFSPVLIIFFIFALLINLLFAFAPYFIVCNNQSFSEAIRSSAGMVFLNFGRTVALMALMFLVNLRILINGMVILGVPLGVIIFISSFSNFAATIFIVVVGGLAIFLTTYLTAVVEVFSTAVWQRGFTDLLKKDEQHILNKENEV